MERAIWIHQLDQLGERTIEEIAATLAPRGITRVYVKAMDGPAWMSEIYAHPLAPSSPAQLARLGAAFEAEGLQVVPWVVCRASSAESQQHLACAVATGGLVVDYEHGYTGFWESGLGEARRYFDALRRAVDHAWLAVAPDPRQVGREYPGDTIAGLTAYLPQVYWTDFRLPWSQVLAAACARCEPLGPCEPVLPCAATPADLQAALAWCEARGHAAVSLWRMGAANTSQLDRFGLTPGPAPAGNAEIPEQYLERGWTTWPAVVANLEGIIGQLLEARR